MKGTAYLGRLALAVALVGPILGWQPPTVAAADARTLEVCASCSFTTIPSAIAAANAGDTIEVRGGTHGAPIVIDRPVTLEGIDRPIVSSGGRGTVIHVTAPDVTIRGFVIRDSGSSYDQEDSGVLVDGARARILENEVLNTLFGIELRQAPDSQIVGNRVVGKPLDGPLRGDGLKVWYSPRAQIIDNQIESTRDCLLWYSDGSIVRDNFVRDGRYGFHFMQTNQSLVEGNRLENNSVGIYLMYGKDLTLRNNLLRANRGPSGDGIGVKEVDGAVINDNVVVDNRVGIYIDNAPFSAGVTNEYRGNVVAYNDEGLALLPLNHGSIFARNSLIDNVEQVAVLGGGSADGNAWSSDGQGNFWSDYAGYDRDGDGIGDLSYRARSLSEQLVDRQPLLRLFRFSPALGAIDLAARAFPIFAAAPKLTDSAPLVVPPPAPEVPAGASRGSPATGPVALVLGLLAIVLLLVVRRSSRVNRGAADQPSTRREPGMPTVNNSRPGDRALTEPGRQDLARIDRASNDSLAIAVSHLDKSYGTRSILRDVSFTARRGEALALWGRNGSGKTTVLRCLLGLTRCSGTIQIGPHDPRRAGPAARRLIGFVPQEMLTFDLEVGELATLIGSLRSVGAAEIAARLDQFGLRSTIHQPVTTLSGGMKQKLGLALAMLGDPPILLLDEPTANLDETSQAALIEQLRSLKEGGRIVIFTSHRWGEVLALADRVIRLSPTEPVETITLGRREAPALAAPTLRIHLDPAVLGRAQDLLASHGYAARRNGTSVAVRVQEDRKAEPLLFLSQLGCPIVDFDLEEGHGEENDTAGPHYPEEPR